MPSNSREFLMHRAHILATMRKLTQRMLQAMDNGQLVELEFESCPVSAIDLIDAMHSKRDLWMVTIKASQPIEVPKDLKASTRIA